MRPLVLSIALLLAAPLARAEPALKGWTGPKPVTPCLCRHPEGKAEVGERICRRIGGKMVTLRCDKVLNNTSWTRVAEGCDVAMLHSAAPIPEGSWRSDSDG